MRKICPGKKTAKQKHLSPSRRRTFRREFVQTGGVEQTVLQAAPLLGACRPTATARSERK